jgi:RNA polymerase sigma-70 factor (ECF subfamily)
LIKGASVSQAPEGVVPTEAQLIEKAKTGDPHAFARLYDAYVDEIYRFIFYRVDDRQTAEDLTSQLFLKAWDGRGRYQFRGSPFKAWLIQIARNLVIDYYRTRKQTAPLEPTTLIKPDPASNVAKEVERKLEGEWLRARLLELTEDQREVLTLKFIHGYSTKEIASMMKKRQGAIRALQMRGLQALAAVIGPDEIEDGE